MMSNMETKTPNWRFNPKTSEPEISEDGINILDSGKNKAWTTAIGSDISINKQSNTLYYYEIRVNFCNVSNSIKIVFGVMGEDYMARILSVTRGLVGSLKGSCPFGYYPNFGIGTLCYFANGSIVRDGVVLNEKAQSYTTNDRIGMLVDTCNNSIAFFKNSQLQTSFINIYNSFQSSNNQQQQQQSINSGTNTITTTNTSSSNNNNNNTPCKPFLIFPSVSLIKENAISIVDNPTIPTFDYEDIIARTMEQMKLAEPLKITPETTTTPATSKTTTTTKTTTPPTTKTTTPPTTKTTTPPTTKTTTTTTTTTTATQTHPKPLPPPPTPMPSTSKTTPVNNKNNNNNNFNNNNNNSSGSNSRTPNGKEGGLPDLNNNCPVCGISFKSIGKDWPSINKHIDECLTFNLLDKETLDPKAKSTTIKCPYSGCKKPITTIDFINHCNEKHLLDDSHNYKCPLCNEKSPNLISHLSKAHLRVQQKQVGVGYSTSILDNDLSEDIECPICLEEFIKGQNVARLECWCIFHTNCISEYLLKSKKCPVHN
ncbi:hypothetical protein RB653_010221 [Dictyostelium firmibasis]|uniref:RING-type E3 ubiquitin transferase n=1 Tax=Dictyostelium firmibasis TaxID=79012 RepID=A0AAN7YM97_9MYCE